MQMQRDKDILEISQRLDAMYKEENNKLQYEAIMAIANHGMNLRIEVDNLGKHHIYWQNNKCNLTNSFDEDLALLLERIKSVS